MCDEVEGWSLAVSRDLAFVAPSQQTLRVRERTERCADDNRPASRHPQWSSSGRFLSETLGIKKCDQLSTS